MRTSFFRVLVASVLMTGSVHAQVFSDFTFFGSVHTSAYTEVSGISATVTNGGIYTNASVYTNVYRVSGTNLAGRIPLSTNLSVAWTGGASNNAVKLSWTRKSGLMRYVVERSLDGGTSWTNHLTVAPSATMWLDNGSNTWTVGTFTNDVAEIGASTFPWVPIEDYEPITNRLGLLERLSNIWNQASTDASSATGTIAEWEGFTNLWTIGSADAISATNRLSFIEAISNLWLTTLSGWSEVPVTGTGIQMERGTLYNTLEIRGVATNDSDQPFYVKSHMGGDSTLSLWGDTRTGISLGTNSYFITKTAHNFHNIPMRWVTGPDSDVIFTFLDNGLLYSGGNVVLTNTLFVSAPASNTAAGSAGQYAIQTLDGTNFFYWYDPDALGVGTAGWPRVEGSTSW